MKEYFAAQTDAESEAASDVHLIDLWGVWRRRKGLVLFSLVVAWGLGALYFFQARPIYETVSAIYIVDKKPPTVPIEGMPSQYQFGQEGDDSPHELIIASPLIVRRAVETYRLGDLSSFTELEFTSTELVDEWLTEEYLRVVPVKRDKYFRLNSRADVFEISFCCPDPDDSAKVVQAIVDTYQEFLGETHEDVGAQTTALITKAKDELLQQLSQKEATYETFRQDAPLLWKDGEGLNLHRERQAQIEEERSEAMLRRSQISARVQSIETALERGDDHQALLLMIAQSAENPIKDLEQDRESPLHDNLLKLLITERELLEKFGADHPDVKLVRKQVEMAREYIRRVAAESTAGREVMTDPEQFLANYSQSLRDELEAINEQVRNLDQLFEQEQQSAKELSTYLVRDTAMRKDLERTDELFEAVKKRLEEINIVKDYGAHAMHVLSKPELGEQVSPLPALVLAVSSILGLFGGFGLAWLVDAADKTFHSPAEMSQHLRLPLVGHIPVIPPARRKKKGAAALKSDPIVCTLHRSNAPPSEAYRAVRTALFFSRQDEEHTVVQVTSPTPGDGKSTLSANLAVVIAQSGKRVLLLDADFRRPTQQKLFGCEMGPGLASVVNGEVEPQDAILATEAENLWVMPCGPMPHNPSELLSSPQFKELLDLLRDQYDFVLIDTPPLLAVSDPSAVAARADAVLLTLKIKKNVRISAMRARDILDDLGAKVAGVVVNGVEDRPGYGYGYGTYQAGYGYGYGYGHYYAEDDRDVAPVAANGNGQQPQTAPAEHAGRA